MSIDFETISPDGLSIYAHWCAWSLAQAHTRSGDRVAIAAYLGDGDRFDRALAEFAVAYAELNERDYARWRPRSAKAGWLRPKGSDY
jgi:hypothetical protein